MQPPLTVPLTMPDPVLIPKLPLETPLQTAKPNPANRKTKSTYCMPHNRTSEPGEAYGDIFEDDWDSPACWRSQTHASMATGGQQGVSLRSIPSQKTQGEGSETGSVLSDAAAAELMAAWDEHILKPFTTIPSSLQTPKQQSNLPAKRQNGSQISPAAIRSRPSADLQMLSLLVPGSEDWEGDVPLTKPIAKELKPNSRPFQVTSFTT